MQSTQKPPSFPPPLPGKDYPARPSNVVQLRHLRRETAKGDGITINSDGVEPAWRQAFILAMRSIGDDVDLAYLALYDDFVLETAGSERIAPDTSRTMQRPTEQANDSAIAIELEAGVHSVTDEAIEAEKAAGKRAANEVSVAVLTQTATAPGVVEQAASGKLRMATSWPILAPF